MHSLRENAFIKIANEYAELRTINEVNTSNSHSCSPSGLISRFEIKDCPSSLSNNYSLHSFYAFVDFWDRFWSKYYEINF
jgi:hypothetical protein